MNLRCNNHIESNSGRRVELCGLEIGHDGPCDRRCPILPSQVIVNAIRYLSMRMNGYGIMIDFDAISVLREAWIRYNDKTLVIVKGERV